MQSEQERHRARRERVIAGAVLGVAFVAAVILVASTLRRPALETYPPTPPDPVEVGATLIGPVTWTLDASHTKEWVAFDFSRASTVPAGDPGGWDIAFRRFHVMTNGGPAFRGNAGIVDLGAVAFDSVTVAPAGGYAGSELRDSMNTAAERWYDYGFTSHILRSKRHVYAIRTADGRYAKLEILSYYCPGAQPGCVTFRYVYQGDGSRHFDTTTGPDG